MSQRIADASAKVAGSFYPLPRMTDNVISAGTINRVMYPALGRRLTCIISKSRRHYSLTSLI
jgi:hypothetical protein